MSFLPASELIQRYSRTFDSMTESDDDHIPLSELAKQHKLLADAEAELSAKRERQEVREVQEKLRRTRQALEAPSPQAKGAFT